MSFWIRSKPGDPLTSFRNVCLKVISDFEIGIMGRVKQLQTTDTQWIGIVCTCLNPLNAAQEVKGYTTDFGQVAGDGLPPHDAYVLSMYTPAAGRRVHGKFYIRGVPEAYQNGGTINSTALAAMKNLGDWLTGQFGIDNTNPNYWWGVYSRANGRSIVPGPPAHYEYDPIALTPWSRHVANDRIGTQRHSMLGRGI